MFKDIRAKHLLLIPAKIAVDIIILVPMWYMLILGDLPRDNAALYFNFMCILFLVLITILITTTTILMTIVILIGFLHNLFVRKR